MIAYSTQEDGSLVGAGFGCIPMNHHAYAEALKKVDDGEATIEPYEQDIEDLRREKISDIKAEGLKRIQAKVGAIDSISMAKLVYQHMWPQLGASQALLDGEAIYTYAAGKIDQAKGASQEQLEAYDPTTDNSWPS